MFPANPIFGFILLFFLTLNFRSTPRKHNEVTVSPENWKKSFWFKALLGQASNKEEIQNTTVPGENMTGSGQERAHEKENTGMELEQSSVASQNLPNLNVSSETHG